MSELLSQRKFAELIGRSNVWVSRLVKDGKLPTVDGKIPKDEGLAAYQASQRLGYDANREHGEKQRKKSKKNDQSPPDEPITLPDDDEPLPTTGMVSVDKVSQAYNRARLAEKTYQAKLKELQYKQEQGQLIPIDQVRQDAESTAVELSGLLNAIAPRIAPLCEGRPAREIEAVIDEAISEAMNSLKKSRFNG